MRSKSTLFSAGARSVLSEGKELEHPLIRDPPAIEPLEMRPLAARTHHSKADGPEKPEQADDRDIKDTVKRPVDLLVELARRPIYAEARNQDSEIQCRIVMVHICDTSHGDKGNVVQEPANNGVETGVVNVVNVHGLEVIVATLPADEVPGNIEGEDTERGGGAPVDDGVTEEEVLDNCDRLGYTYQNHGGLLTIVVPTAHAETNMEEWPLPELGGKIILLVRVRNQRIVGSHHSNVQVNEILEERRSIRVRVAVRKLLVPVAFNVPMGVHVAGFVLFDACRFNLFKTPLRQVDVSSSQVAAEISVLQAEGGRERSDLGIVSRGCVANNLDLPVVLGVTNSGVAIARNFPVRLGNRGSN